MGDRSALSEFWIKQAHSPTVQTMMLNKFAEQVDAQERVDILNSLPDLSDMNIIELGAGIGRFTPTLAEKAEHVTAVDIVESFIEVNKADNQHMGNITFQTGDASDMNVDLNRVDLLFTNWLLMYLTDAEVTRLLQNALAWLCPGGYFHIRESCSESSKRTSAVSTPNSTNQVDSNPTHYRHICQYLELLNAVAFLDESKDVVHKFQVLWSKSVETYIQAYDNWRQVQIMVKKIVVPVSDKKNSKAITALKNSDVNSLVKILTSDSLSNQAKFDAHRAVRHVYFHERSFVSKFILEALGGLRKTPSLVLNLVPDDRLAVSPFEFSEALDATVHSVESNMYAFNSGLAEAIKKNDKLVRFHYVDGVEFLENEESMTQLSQNYNLIVGVRLINNTDQAAKMFSHLVDHLTNDGKFLLLEESDNEESLKKILTDVGFQSPKVKPVTAEFFEDAKRMVDLLSEKLPKLSSFYQAIVESNNGWFIFEADYVDLA